MGWVEDVSEAINFIEDNITADITIDDIAKSAALSPFYFQKGFAMICGFTVGEYIRRRRLSLAGSELISTDAKIIDLALKYGYESPDSFTKAFTRFHGVTPTAVRKDGAVIKSFASLKIKFSLEGGSTMEYKIVEKPSFTVLGASKAFKYSEGFTEVPKFWKEFFESGKGKSVCGMYGVSIDKDMGGDKFEYLIADNYNPALEVPEGFTTKVIPAHFWAVFPCRGAMPDSITDVQKKIFSQWLPNCRDYEIAEGYNIEMYMDPRDYKNGIKDENYYSEVWIPVKKKK